MNILSELYNSRFNYRSKVSSLKGLLKGSILPKSVIDKMMGVGVITPLYFQYNEFFIINFNGVEGIDHIDIDYGNGEPVITLNTNNTDGMSALKDLGEGDFEVVINTYSGKSQINSYTYSYNHQVSFEPIIKYMYTVSSFEINGVSGQKGFIDATSPTTIKAEGNLPPTLFWNIDEEIIESSDISNNHPITKDLAKGFHFIKAYNYNEGTQPCIGFLNIS